MNRIPAWLAGSMLFFSIHASPQSTNDLFQDVVAKYLTANPKPVLPEEARKYKVQAELALEQKRFTQAAQLYAKALEIAPWWPAGRFNRALIMAELKDYSEAIQEMRRYHLLEPNAPDARPAQDKIYQWELAEQQNPIAGKVFKDCEACPEMVVIPLGSYLMGGSRQITLSRPFAVGKTEVTFAQWDACVVEGGCTHRPDDRGWGRGNQPVMNVNWDDAKQYVVWLARKTGNSYRLLTEAEWEYAARAGTTTTYYWGDSDSDICQYASVREGIFSSDGCGTERPSAVASKRPNAFGLYDMLGNMWEWLEDCRQKNDDVSGVPSDGSALATGDCRNRLMRGGAWSYHQSYVLARGTFVSISTGYRGKNVGFRVARTF